MAPTGILSIVALLTNKYDGKGQKGTRSTGQKPLGQCYLGGAVHYCAILAVTPTGIISFVSLLPYKYDSKGQEGPGIAGPKAPGSVLSWQCCPLQGHLGGDPYWDSFICSTAY